MQAYVMCERPNDQRNFVHGRIGRAIGGFIGGGPGGAVTGFLTGGVGGGGTSAGTIAQRAQNQLLASFGLPAKGGESFGSYFRNFSVPQNIQNQILNALGMSGNGNGPGPVDCSFDPRLEDRGRGFCEGISPSGGMGELRKGRYGPAEEPFFETRNVRSCLAGFVLGDDKLCYKKGTISNKQRLWPKGTAPLLTGGQMKAIRVAAGAGAKLERTTKRLQKIGLMKKPAPRRPAAHQHAKAVPNIVSL